MFENVEKKLKTLAKINLYCGFILAVVSFIGLLIIGGEEATGWDILYAVFIALVWVLVGFITSWPIYAFAEIVEGIKETNKTLKYIFQDDIRKYQSIEHEQEFQRRKAEYERAEAIRQKEQERQEAERLAKEQKEERIAAYWTEHAEEKKALLDKKSKAEALLEQVSGQERDTLQELIRSIDYELTKDR